MDRLQQFLTLDSHARDRAALTSMAAGFASGALARVFGYPFEVSAYGAAAMVCFFYFLQAWLYCRIPSARTVRKEQPLIGRRFYLVATGLASLLLMILPERSVEAAVLERRLRKLTQKSPLSPQAAKEIVSTLEQASKERLAFSVASRVQALGVVKASVLQRPYPPFTDAASALGQYGRRISSGVPIPAEVQRAIDLAAKANMAFGAEHGLAALRKSQDLTIDRAEAQTALSALTSVIQLPGIDPTLRLEALLMRAGLYSTIRMTDEALADAQAAEKLGAVDLSEILEIESLAFVERGLKGGRTEDFSRAVNLLTVEMNLPPSKLIASNPEFVLVDRTALFENRAIAYYGLHQYRAAIEDSKHVLELLNGIPEQSWQLFVKVSTGMQYLMIVASYLHLGNIEEALSAASEWKSRSNGDPTAERLVNTLRSLPFDPQTLLNQIEPLFLEG